MRETRGRVQSAGRVLRAARRVGRRAAHLERGERNAVGLCQRGEPPRVGEVGLPRVRTSHSAAGALERCAHAPDGHVVQVRRREHHSEDGVEAGCCAMRATPRVTLREHCDRPDHASRASREERASSPPRRARRGLGARLALRLLLHPPSERRERQRIARSDELLEPALGRQEAQRQAEDRLQRGPANLPQRRPRRGAEQRDGLVRARAQQRVAVPQRLSFGDRQLDDERHGRQHVVQVVVGQVQLAQAHAADRLQRPHEAGVLSAYPAHARLPKEHERADAHEAKPPRAAAAAAAALTTRRC